jgi:hypothetical protein
LGEGEGEGERRQGEGVDGLLPLPGISAIAQLPIAEPHFVFCFLSSAFCLLLSVSHSNHFTLSA